MSPSAPIALITGASLGIGKALAELFARKKCDLVLVARNGERLEEIARNLHQHHLVKVKVIAKDLSQMKAIDEVYQEVATSGWPIEYLVNNADCEFYGSILETSWKSEHQMIELNVSALTQLTKLFARDMVARGHGRIMNVASTAAFQPGPKMAVYCATKAYVLSYSQAVANELENTGVTVTTLCPGADTFMGRPIPSSEAVAQFGYDAMVKGKKLAVHGVLNSISAEILRIMPPRLSAKIMRRYQDADA